MKHLDLFSGIGGFSLAADWVWGDEHEIVSFVEIDPFCQKVLKKHWPDVPIYGDIETYEPPNTTIDLVTGGYPCQAFSTASHGQIVAEDLSGWLLSIVKKVKPKFIIAENVAKNTIADISKQFKNIGYKSASYCFAASDFGKNHARNRWWSVAHADHKSKLHGKIYAEMDRVSKTQDNKGAYADYARVLRVPNGVPDRVDRLKSLGNAIVPQVVVPIMQEIRYIDTKYDT